MSRSAAATTAGRQRSIPRSPVPRHPRRISGPSRARLDAGALVAPGGVAYPRPQRLPSRPPLGVVAGGAAIASRVAGVALDVSGSRAMDRLVRSRAWIVIIAFGLIGIVAMQVSMLKLNAGIGRAVETVSTLERTNAVMRGDLSRLSDGSRIQSLAGARGFVMPAPADVTYLRAGNLRGDAARAARRMVAPDPAIVGPAGAATPRSIGSAAELAGTAGQAAPATATATPQAAAPAPAATPPPATAATTATTATAPTVPAAAAPPATPPSTGATTAAPATAASLTPAAAPAGGTAPSIAPPATSAR
jgi:hypothetical protein